MFMIPRLMPTQEVIMATEDYESTESTEASEEGESHGR